MAREKLLIRMEINTMVLSSEEQEVALEFINLIDISDMKENGKIIAFMAAENFIEIPNYFFKVDFSMDSNMAQANIAMKTEMFFRAFSSKIKKEAMEFITLLKEGLFNQNLILYQHKYQPLLFQTDLFTLESIKMEVEKAQVKLT